MTHPRTKPQSKAEFEKLYSEEKFLGEFTKKTKIYLYKRQGTEETVLVKMLHLFKAGLNRGNCHVGWLEGNLIQKFNHENVIRVTLFFRSFLTYFYIGVWTIWNANDPHDSYGVL